MPAGRIEAIRASAATPAGVPSRASSQTPAKSIRAHPDPQQESLVSSAPPAKFFVNQGVAPSRADMQNLLRPLIKQTVTYRYVRGHDVVAHGTGWVERIV